MPRRSKDEKRPADVIGNAIKVAKIATGEDTEVFDGPPEVRRIIGPPDWRSRRDPRKPPPPDTVDGSLNARHPS
jgi:hypothetical protein